MIEIARDDGIEVVERNLSLSELYTADEVFTTGTMGELAPVLEVDGRRVGAGARGPVTERLQVLYAEQTARLGTPLPF